MGPGQRVSFVVLCAAFVGASSLWVRSYYVSDEVMRSSSDQARRESRELVMVSSRGQFALISSKYRFETQARFDSYTLARAEWSHRSSRAAPIPFSSSGPADWLGFRFETEPQSPNSSGATTRIAVPYWSIVVASGSLLLFLFMQQTVIWPVLLQTKRRLLVELLLCHIVGSYSFSVVAALCAIAMKGSRVLADEGFWATLALAPVTAPLTAAESLPRMASEPMLKPVIALGTCAYLVSFAMLTPRLRLVVLKKRRSLSGLCRNCGYDLRATPQRCPECGTVRASRRS
jgi:hypothetical protein